MEVVYIFGPVRWRIAYVLLYYENVKDGKSVFVISGFRSGVKESFALLRFHAAWNCTAHIADLHLLRSLFECPTAHVAGKEVF